MEALRLIKTVRHALTEARATSDILHEAWQSGLLTEALGARIAEHDGEVGEGGEGDEEDGDGEDFATLGQLLCEAGAHTASCLRQPPDPGDTEGPGGGLAEWARPGLVERLTELGDLEPVLVELTGLLEEMNESLVVLACGADTESLYWSCIDGLDAGSECRDLVAELLRRQRRLTAGREGAQAEETEEEREETGETGEFDRVPGAARREEPRLVVPLGPPIPAACAQPRVEPSAAGSCPPRAAEERRSESSPARSVLIEASNSCICSSSDFGVPGAPPAVVPGVGGSVQGSDMRGPLQLGGAV